MSITKNVLLTPYSSMKKNPRKIRMIFDIENWLWRSDFGTIDKLSFIVLKKYNIFWQKILLLTWPPSMSKNFPPTSPSETLELAASPKLTSSVKYRKEKFMLLFCFLNCSKPLCEKNVFLIEKNFWKFETESQDFAKFLRITWNNLFKQWKVRTLF